MDPEYAFEKAQKAFAECMAAFERRDIAALDEARERHKAWGEVYYRLTRGLSIH